MYNNFNETWSTFKPSVPFPSFYSNRDFFFVALNVNFSIHDGWMEGVFNTLDKVLRVKYGLVEMDRFESSEQSGKRAGNEDALFLLDLCDPRSLTRNETFSKLVLIDKVAFLIARNLGSNFRFHPTPSTWSTVSPSIFIFIGFQHYCRLRFTLRSIAWRLL